MDNYQVGWIDLVFFFFWVVYIISRIRNRQEETRIIAANTAVPVKLEIHPNQVYVWNAESDEFIAQSKDVQTAMQVAFQRYPEKSFKIVDKVELTK